MITIPQVNFSNQAVIPNFPKELHGAIVVNQELIEFAKSAITQVKIKMLEAKSVERFAIHAASGEASWRAMNGPQKAIHADKMAHVIRQLALLSQGKNSSSWDGWIDRDEWNSIISVIES